MKADSQSLDARLYLARTYFHRGKAQFALDQQAAAKNDFLQSEDTFREIGSRSVTPLYIRQRGENLFWLAKTCKLLQQTICLSQANRELLVLAGQQPQVFGSDPAAGWVTEVQGWVQK